MTVTIQFVDFGLSRECDDFTIRDNGRLVLFASGQTIFAANSDRWLWFDVDQNEDRVLADDKPGY